MKIKNLLYTMLILLALPLNAQIEMAKEVSNETESATQGFFVNGGSQKIEALECYTFKDLTLSFDLKKEHFVCDRVDIQIKIGTAETGWITYKNFSIDQDEFTALFGDKKYAYFKIFSSEDIEEKAKWYCTISQHFLTRSRLQYTSIKSDVQGAKMMVKVLCGKITGEGETSEVVSDRVVTRKYNTWKWTDSSTFDIELKNRIYIKTFKLLMKGFPPAPVATGNCYE
ncbi:hypothetical protein [Flavobacterium sp. HNIBRBA15423]|uniref:hypothetical protein n=1 Tax=Flavobacterium sp. HNIBRBA15423 TaxID=3458683 RepID=UPI004044EB7D